MRGIFQRTILSCLALALTMAKVGATAPTYLITFNGTNGSRPSSGLLLSSNILYGEADGYVFSINTDGTGFTNLCYSGVTNGGNTEYGPLVLSGNVLYGTTVSGGSNQVGTVFAVNTDGTGFTNLFTFNDTNGPSRFHDEPVAGLLLAGNRLYGTTLYGSNGLGSVFAINTDGTGFTNLYLGVLGGADRIHAGLTISGNTLYGAAIGYGADTNDYGSIFAINTDGTGFTNLYYFSTPIGGINSDGAIPEQTLLLSGNTLYGTTSQGGAYGDGTIFRVNTDGTGFTNLYNLPLKNPYGLPSTSSLVISGNTLYGGAAFNSVFSINTDGTGFTLLANGGSESVVGLVLSGHTFYGVEAAGYQNLGTVFALPLPAPSLNIQLTNGEVILNWNDPTATYWLQAAPNVDGGYTNVPGTISPYTNVISDSQMFFRLESN